MTRRAFVLQMFLAIANVTKTILVLANKQQKI